MIKPLTDETFDDAKRVVLARFPASALDVLRKTMDNPLRATCPEVGDIKYENGCPVGFRAANRRRLYFGSQCVFGRVRGLTCRLRDSSKTVIAELADAQLHNPRGCVIAFSNTQCKPTEQRAVKMGAILGPESCTRNLCRFVRPLNLLVYKVLKRFGKEGLSRKSGFSTLESRNFSREMSGLTIRRCVSSDLSFFDDLMKRYLKSNKGLVSARGTSEMQWLFGKSILSGESVLLVASQNGVIVGYVLLSSDKLAKKWQLMDWFAIEDDRHVLEALLKVACLFLKKKTPAMILKAVGFPMKAQALLKRYLPYSLDSGGVNYFSYNFIDSRFASLCQDVVDTEKSWFFTPMDGDMCM